MSALALLRVRGPSAVQDGGRRGRMHEGVPPGGALVPELLAAANAAARNPPLAAAIELFAGMTVEARGGPLLVATDDGAARTLAPGDALDVPPPERHRVRYLAVRGGIDVPIALGGRGTLAVAGLGGHEGRWLRAGDVLAAGALPEAAPAGLVAVDPARVVRVVAGPDLDRFPDAALVALLAGEWTISAMGDRTGIRLEGPALPRADDDRAVSAPMVRGAIQVPAGGAPIVLGPDHPTTGGYPVLACIASADWGSFAVRRPGEKVRFRA